MQAVILAAGESSRFWPLNSSHKALMKIQGKPIIQRNVDGLFSAGIGEVIIVQGPGKEIEKSLGKQRGIKYVIQKKPRGMGDALKSAEKYIRDSFLVVNAERFDSAEYAKQLIKNGKGFGILASETNEPWLFGMLKVSGNSAIGIIEKPKKGKEPSNLKASGVYLLPGKFFRYHKAISHYSFEDALNRMMKDCPAKIVLAKDEMIPLKYPWHMLLMARSSMVKTLKNDISKKASISKSAVLEGYVHIGHGTRVMENAVIRGPCWIGENCMIGNNALVRESDIESHCIIGANCEVARSAIQENVHLHSGYVGDSVIGKGCRIGAGIITANVRSDKHNAISMVKNERIDTGMNSMGCIMGENVKIGIGTKTMPGVLIGKNCEIGPCSVVMKNVPDNTRFHTKFHRIIKKKHAK